MKKKIIIVLLFIFCFAFFNFITVQAKAISYPLIVKIDEDHQKSIKPYGENYYYSEGSLWWKKEYMVEYSVFTGYHYDIHFNKASKSVYYDPNLANTVTISIDNNTTTTETYSYTVSRSLGLELGKSTAKICGGLKYEKTKTTTFSVSSSYNAVMTISGDEGWYSIDSVIEADLVLCNRYIKKDGNYEQYDSYTVYSYRSNEPGLKLYYTKEQH